MLNFSPLTRLLPLLALAVVDAGLSAAAEQACQPVASDLILGRDLAFAVPALADLPSDLPVSYAPVPGLQRVFHPDELRRLALAHHLEDPQWKTNLCFVWALAPLSREAIRAAMEKTLAGRNPDLEIIEASHAEVPGGALVFPLSGLSAVSDKPVIWKGYVAYASSRHFNTWASVRIRVHERRLVANGALHRGDRVAIGQCRPEIYDGPLTRAEPYTDAGQIAGLVALREVSDGSVLLDGMFEKPKEVERGDLVTVLVQNGNARVETQGVAEFAGRRGEIIVVRNPHSGVKYKARIEDQSKVLVVPGGEAGLVVDKQAPFPSLHNPATRAPGKAL